MITDDAEFTVSARRQQTPVTAELLLRAASPPLRYQPGQYVLLGDPDARLVARSSRTPRAAVRHAERHAVRVGGRTVSCEMRYLNRLPDLQFVVTWRAADGAVEPVSHD